ncbi:EAL domain-containing protein [Photobacterium galatheae]|nr:EAL domain-containing protein [Photobacterium galatheae]MCM0150525.1 EAL domain-containing protein [Photobacterium galatheae]
MSLLQNILDEALNTTFQASLLLEAHCDNQTTGQLKRMATLAPNIRSVNLIQDNYIYCSSLFDQELSKSDQTYFEVDDTVFIKTHNYFNPDEKILFISHRQGERYAIASIDIQYIKKLLNTLSNHIPLTITLNNRQNVTYSTGYSPETKGTRIALNSDNQQLTITSVLSEKMYLSYLGNSFALPVILSCIIALSAGIMFYQYLNRPLSLREALYQAVSNDDFIPLLQPIVNPHGDICGAEVLLRWNHPKQGFMMPDQFIPLAETTGLIHKMTSQALSKVKNHLIEHQPLLPDGFHLAINISPEQCNDLTFYEDCQHFLSSFPNGKIQLIIELTERELIQSTTRAIRLFDKLRTLGAQIALDDFGTGHASLSYINQFEIDILKIDKSFIRKIGSLDRPSHIVDNVVDLAERLNIEIVAEGVENLTQEAYLKQRHIQYFQGYLYDKPLAPEIFIERLARQSRKQPCPEGQRTDIIV